MTYFDVIKSTAREHGCKTSDLIALSPGCDPFYVGTPGQMAKAEWGTEQYKGMGSPPECHVRRVHYWIVSQDPKVVKPDGNDYLNTVQDWAYLNLALKYARYAELIPAKNFIDRRNPPPIVNNHHWMDSTPSDDISNLSIDRIAELISNEIYCFNPHNSQAYSMEIFCEKSTMNDVLGPLCKKYGVNLVTGLGELSITSVERLVHQRIKAADKNVVIFYISDFDPAGECMPVSVARKIEYFMKMQEDVDHTVKLRHIMLTKEQCEEYELPRTPIKETERRRIGFEDRYGAGATELDALESLHPGELHKLVTKEVIKYFDQDAWDEAVNKNILLNEAIESCLTDAKGVLQGVLSSLTKMDMEYFDEENLERGEEIDDMNENWLYSSDRGYMEQLMNYKKFQGKEAIE